ncbi:hypothetical protein E4U54_002357 [Claviceps lovelessii]|nr:hypothetical protein E4U54_002357 [Claviceps lovelessii]
MTDPAPSPKRRHILSSINPQQHTNDDVSRRQPKKTHGHDERAASQIDGHAGSPGRSREPESFVDATTSKGDGQSQGSHTRPRRSRLRLKTGSSRRRRTSREGHGDDYVRDANSSSSRPHHRRHHHRRDRDRDRDHHHDEHRHHHRRRHRHRARSPTPPNPHDPDPLDPEAAFRESLFDAMADDEGASYWESVYGQPIHVYSNEKVGATGELEQMTEEEYAAHVRQRMWEKTHAGLLEERAKQDERRKQKQEEEARARKLRREMDQSLRRGEERRQRRRRRAQWDEYCRAWTAWNGTIETLAWPVAATDGGPGPALGLGRPGGGHGVREEDVRSFYVHGLDVERVGEGEFVSKLKEERVRWHPDKMQQRLGGSVDGEVMRDVTAVFQIIDKLWTEVRARG